MTENSSAYVQPANNNNIPSQQVHIIHVFLQKETLDLKLVFARFTGAKTGWKK